MSDVGPAVAAGLWHAKRSASICNLSSRNCALLPPGDVDAGVRGRYDAGHGDRQDRDSPLDPHRVREAHRPRHLPARRGRRADRLRAARSAALHRHPEDGARARGRVRRRVGGAHPGPDRARRRLRAGAGRGGSPRQPRGLSRRTSVPPALTVEVAESSLDVDRERKGGAYASAGLADYWIVNLIDRALEVYREPAVDPSSPFGWRYTRREVVRPPRRRCALSRCRAPLSASPICSRERSPHRDGSVARPDRTARRRMRDRGTAALDRRQRVHIDQAVLAQRPGSPRVVLRDRADPLRGRGSHAAGRGLPPAVAPREAGINAA